MDATVLEVASRAAAPAIENGASISASKAAGLAAANAAISGKTSSAILSAGRSAADAIMSGAGEAIAIQIGVQQGEETDSIRQTILSILPAGVSQTVQEIAQDSASLLKAQGFSDQAAAMGAQVIGEISSLTTVQSSRDAAAAAAATALTNGFESADATVAGKAAVELSKLGATKEEIIFAAQIAAEASAGGASLSEAIRQAKAKFISTQKTVIKASGHLESLPEYSNPNLASAARDFIRSMLNQGFDEIASQNAGIAVLSISHISNDSSVRKSGSCSCRRDSIRFSPPLLPRLLEAAEAKKNGKSDVEALATAKQTAMGIKNGLRVSRHTTGQCICKHCKRNDRRWLKQRLPVVQ